MPEQVSVFKVRYIFFFAAVLLAFLAVASFSPQDAALLAGGIDGVPRNWIGKLGAVFGLCLFHLFGVAAYAVPVLALVRLVRLPAPGAGKFSAFLGGSFLILSGLILLFGLNPEMFASLCDRLGLGRAQTPALALSGGVIGQVLAAPAYPPYELAEGVLRNFIGAVGTMIFGWALLTGGAVIIYVSDWHRFIMDHITLPEAPSRRPAAHERIVPGEDEEIFEGPEKNSPPAESSPRSRLASMLRKVESEQKEQEMPPPSEENTAGEEPGGEDVLFDPKLEAFEEDPGEAPASGPAEKSAPALPGPSAGKAAAPARVADVGRTVVEAGERAAAVERPVYVLPPVTMLGKGTDVSGETLDNIKKTMLILQRTLDSFKVPGEVVGYVSGPRITRYEISLAEGVNVKKVETISNNILMNLEAPSIRVLAPIPGRNVVGIEVPNTKSEAVFMRSVMETEEWEKSKGIPVVLGKNIAGTPTVIDLAKAPHLLIAGSTGSGKSVCMNTLIMSLLFRFNPEELRLIMVDPKRVEFEDYRRLPHLITPVINDAKKVPIALRWAVTEMENRYKILASAGVKKLAEFNALSKNGEPIRNSDGEIIEDNFGNRISHIPILIVIIDELAELRMQDSWKDSETYIARIAQLGRAAGVHIVVATQRPSTDIITGFIKANLPTRIAFRVLQQVDSRVILDMPGAENLLGYGDMLALLPGTFGLERIQGALVDDKDIKAIVKFVSDQRPQNFDESVVAEEEDAEELGEGEYDRPARGGRGSADDDDDVFDDMDKAEIAPLVKKYMQPGDDETMRRALEVVILDRKASTSYIQRRLKIGYNRAAEIMDLMEERGIVGPPSGSGSKREILIFDGMEINEQGSGYNG
ncbi:MAG: DNA translocase FtsK [Lentisphaeria bacterium]|nr:DNA translocase FtsK [Lentisphaeria bacterium]